MKLRGNCQATVDEKGRLKYLPCFWTHSKSTELSSISPAPPVRPPGFTPLKVWGEIEDKLAKTSSANKAKRKFLMRTSYYGQAVEIDGQGRVPGSRGLEGVGTGEGRGGCAGRSRLPGSDEPHAGSGSVEERALHRQDDKALEDLGI